MMKKKLVSALIGFIQLGYVGAVQAQDKPQPIIDVHVHLLSIPGANIPGMCPWFLKDMRGGDPHIPMQQPMNSECKEPLAASASPEDYRKEVLAEAERLNVTMVISGDEAMLKEWKKAAPKRVIASLSISPDMKPEVFREKLASGFYQVVGEVAPQYAGLSPSDKSLYPYYAIAEELGVPVGIHMGTGGNGMANVNRGAYRASLGNPFLLEDMLAAHPKLKIWVMHAGYPMIDEMLALMGANAYVYVDIAGLIWSYPRAEVDMYLERLVQAGFGERVLYGTDLMIWPGLLKTSINLVQEADYLTEQQKRNILFNNAVRFFNWKTEDFK